MAAGSTMEVAERLAATARAEERALLLESEGMHLLASLGLGVPTWAMAGGPGDVPDLDLFPGDRVVVKLLAPDLAHRTELGGVLVVPRTSHAVVRALEDLAAKAPGRGASYLLEEYVPHDVEPGGEMLLGVRWTPEFGTVATLAIGGVSAEALARLADGATSLLWPAGAPRPGALEAALAGTPLGVLLTGGLRGRRPRLAPGPLAAALEDFGLRASRLLPWPLAEIEVNPLVARDGTLTALDALVRLGSPEGGPGRPGDAPLPPSRRDGLAALLRPGSVAVVGASARGTNPGRVILRNLLAAGLPPSAVTVVKAGAETLDGCPCVPDVGALEPVDLLVVSVGAAEAPGVVEAAVRGRKARGIILTTGGLGEGETDKDAGLRLTGLLAQPGAPALNGGNCLGIRSLPGRYDTLFIPGEKLGFPPVPPHPVAVLSQSGAFAIARSSALPWLNPRLVITVGNQLDVTLGEWAEHLVDEDGLDVLACYVEGFRPGDGARFLRAVEAHRARGRQVIVYRAGRTPAGRDATASHTASLAGDAAVANTLARAAGALVARTVDDFTDLLALSVRLAGRGVAGRAAGLVSNAGFECVAMADSLGFLEAAPLAPPTRDRLGSLLREARLDAIVSPTNPLDLTPITGDAAYAASVEAILADPGVDIAVVGCVPLTPALRTLPAGLVPGDEAAHPEGLAARLGALWSATAKAWVASVDGGPRYDGFARLLEGAGIPVLRRADRATALLARYVASRLGVTDPGT